MTERRPLKPEDPAGEKLVGFVRGQGLEVPDDLTFGEFQKIEPIVKKHQAKEQQISAEEQQMRDASVKRKTGLRRPPPRPPTENLRFDQPDSSRELSREQMRGSRGIVPRGLEAGTRQIAASIPATEALVRGAIGDETGAKRAAMDAEGQLEKAAAIAPQTTLRDVAEGEGSFGDWAVGVFGQQAPVLATFIGTGGLGGAVAKGFQRAAIAGLKPTVRQTARVARQGRNAAAAAQKEARRKSFRQFTAKEASIREGTRSAAGRVGGRTTAANRARGAADEAADRAARVTEKADQAREAMRRAIDRTPFRQGVGQAAGAAVTGFGLHATDTSQWLIDPEASGTVQQRALSGIGTASLASLTEIAPTLAVLRNMGFGTATAGHLTQDALKNHSAVRRIATGTAKQATLEASAEVGSEVIKDASYSFLNDNMDMLDSESMWKYFEVAAAGALVGGPVGGATSVRAQDIGRIFQLREPGPTEEAMAGRQTQDDIDQHRRKAERENDRLLKEMGVRFEDLGDTPRAQRATMAQHRADVAESRMLGENTLSKLDIDGDASQAVRIGQMIRMLADPEAVDTLGVLSDLGESPTEVLAGARAELERTVGPENVEGLIDDSILLMTAKEAQLAKSDQRMLNEGKAVRPDGKVYELNEREREIKAQQINARRQRIRQLFDVLNESEAGEAVSEAAPANSALADELQRARNEADEAAQQSAIGDEADTTIDDEGGQTVAESGFGGVETLEGTLSFPLAGEGRRAQARDKRGTQSQRFGKLFKRGAKAQGPAKAARESAGRLFEQRLAERRKSLQNDPEALQRFDAAVEQARDARERITGLREQMSDESFSDLQAEEASYQRIVELESQIEEARAEGGRDSEIQELQAEIKDIERAVNKPEGITDTQRQYLEQVARLREAQESSDMPANPIETMRAGDAIAQSAQSAGLNPDTVLSEEAQALGAEPDIEGEAAPDAEAIEGTERRIAELQGEIDVLLDEGATRDSAEVQNRQGEVKELTQALREAQDTDLLPRVSPQKAREFLNQFDAVVDTSPPSSVTGEADAVLTDADLSDAAEAERPSAGEQITGRDAEGNPVRLNLVTLVQRMLGRTDKAATGGSQETRQVQGQQQQAGGQSGTGVSRKNLSRSLSDVLASLRERGFTMTGMSDNTVAFRTQGRDITVGELRREGVAAVRSGIQSLTDATEIQQRIERTDQLLAEIGERGQNERRQQLQNTKRQLENRLDAVGATRELRRVAGDERRANKRARKAGRVAKKAETRKQKTRAEKVREAEEESKKEAGAARKRRKKMIRQARRDAAAFRKALDNYDHFFKGGANASPQKVLATIRRELNNTPAPERKAMLNVLAGLVQERIDGSTNALTKARAERRRAEAMVRAGEYLDSLNDLRWAEQRATEADPLQKLMQEFIENEAQGKHDFKTPSSDSDIFEIQGETQDATEFEPVRRLEDMVDSLEARLSDLPESSPARTELANELETTIGILNKLSDQKRWKHIDDKKWGALKNRLSPLAARMIEIIDARVTPLQSRERGNLENLALTRQMAEAAFTQERMSRQAAVLGEQVASGRRTPDRQQTDTAAAEGQQVDNFIFQARATLPGGDLTLAEYINKNPKKSVKQATELFARINPKGAFSDYFDTLNPVIDGEIEGLTPKQVKDVESTLKAIDKEGYGTFLSRAVRKEVAKKLNKKQLGNYDLIRGVIDDVTDALGMPRLGLDVVNREGAGGIILDSKLIGLPEKTFNEVTQDDLFAILHEVSHGFEEHLLFNNIEQWEALQKEHAKWRAFHQRKFDQAKTKAAKKAALLNAVKQKRGRPASNKLSEVFETRGESLVTNEEYALGFSEWFADVGARVMLESDALPRITQNAEAQSLIKKYATGLRKMFRTARASFKKKFGQEVETEGPIFRSMVEQLLEKRAELFQPAQQPQQATPAQRMKTARRVVERAQDNDPDAAQRRKETEFSQGIIDGLQLDGVEVEVVSWAQAAADNPKFNLDENDGLSYVSEFDNKTGAVKMRIWVNERRAGNGVERQGVLHHELGHAIVDSLSQRITEEDAKAIWADYERWANENNLDTTSLKHLAKTKRSLLNIMQYREGARTMLKNLSEAERKEALSFHEYAADNIARWIETNRRPRTVIEKFFKNIADKLKALMAKFRGKGLPDTSMSDALNRLWDARRSNAALRHFNLWARLANNSKILDGRFSESLDKTFKVIRRQAANESGIPPERMVMAAENAKARPFSLEGFYGARDVMIAKLTEEERRVVARAFMSPKIKRKMYNLLRNMGHDGDGILDDQFSTMAVGYMLWSAGALEMTPGSAKAFQGIGKFINDVTGTTSELDQAAEIMKAIESDLMAARESALHKNAKQGSLLAQGAYTLESAELSRIRELMDIRGWGKGTNPDAIVTVLNNDRVLGARQISPQRRKAIARDIKQGVFTQKFVAEHEKMSDYALNPDKQFAITKVIGNEPYQRQARFIVSSVEAMGNAFRTSIGKLVLSDAMKARWAKIPAMRRFTESLVTDVLQEGGREGMLNLKERQRGTWDTRFNRIFETLTSDEQKQLRDLIMKRIDKAPPKIMKARAEYRKLMRQMRNYAKNSGLPMGDQGADYFPWVFDPTTVEKKSDQLFQAWSNGRYRDHWEAVATRHDSARVDAQGKFVDDAAYEAYVRGWIQAIMTQNNGLADDSRPAPEQLDPAPHVGALNTRELAFLDDANIAPKADRELLAGLFNDDMATSMAVYIDQLVKRVEYARAFGHRGERFRQMIAQARQQGATDADIELMHNMLNSAMGTLGLEVAPFWKKVFEPFNKMSKRILDENGQAFPTREAANKKIGEMKTGGIVVEHGEGFAVQRDITGDPKKFRDAFGWLVTYQNFRTLAFAAFTNLADVAGIAFRTGDLRMTGRAYALGLNQVWKRISDRKLPPEERRARRSSIERLAEELGVVVQSSVSDVLGQFYGGNQFSGTARKWNDTFFKWNGMEFLTRTTRTMAVAAGVEFMAYHGQRAQAGDAKSTEALLELGLDPADLRIGADGRLELLGLSEIDAALEGTSYSTGSDVRDAQAQGATLSEGALDVARDDRVRQALYRMVDESVLRPTATQRPSWMNDPNWQLFSHLKGFMYTYHERVLRRAYGRAAQGNMAPLVLMSTYVGAMMAADWLRELVQHGPKGDPMKVRWGLRERILDGIHRSGTPGIFVLPMDMAKSHRFGRSQLAQLGGPFTSQAEQLYRGVFGSGQLGTALKRAVPASQVLESVENYSEWALRRTDNEEMFNVPLINPWVRDQLKGE